MSCVNDSLSDSWRRTEGERRQKETEGERRRAEDGDRSHLAEVAEAACECHYVLVVHMAGETETQKKL